MKERERGGGGGGGSPSAKNPHKYPRYVDHLHGHKSGSLQGVHPGQVLLRAPEVLGDREEAAR